jgi:hypothetical protein
MAQGKPVLELFTEVENYTSVRSKELTSADKRLTADLRDSIADEKKELAVKYAVEMAGRTSLEKTDHYYLGRRAFKPDSVFTTGTKRSRKCSPSWRIF